MTLLKKFYDTFVYRNINVNSMQMELYLNNNASPHVLKLVELKSRSFGATVEKIVREIYGFNRIPTSFYDHTYHNIKIEQKSSRYWCGGRTKYFKWQHIEPKHDFDILLLVGVGFHDLEYYVLSMNDVKQYILEGKIKKQGTGDGQGYWFKQTDIPLTQIHETQVKSVILSIYGNH